MKKTRTVRKTAARPGQKVPLLSGGNPQIAKGYGDDPVQAYIQAIPDWKREVTAWVDQVVSKTLPKVRKAVKYNSPLYGARHGTDWFMSLHCFTRYVKVAFFRGADLDPVPPGKSRQKYVRYLDIHEDDARDEAQLAAWVRQASNLPGEKL